jgi:hypothetical protein
MPIRFNFTPTQQQQRAQQDQEIEGYTLVGRGGWLTVLKYILGAGLAYLNARLFWTLIPHLITALIVAGMAVCLEISAVYCVVNYVRSIGPHRKWMGRFAVILGGFSLIHGTFSLIHETGYLAGWWIIPFYSNVVALPVIIVMLSLMFAILTMKHWSAKTYEALADRKIETLSNRADVLMEKNRLLDRQELVELKAGLFDDETRIKGELVHLAARRVAAGEQLNAVLAAIKDPRLREEIQIALAQITDDSAPQAPAQPTVNNPSPAIVTPDSFSQEERRIAQGVRQRQLPAGRNGRSSH